MGLPSTATRIERYAITIPANTDNTGLGATILSLLVAAGFPNVTTAVPGSSLFAHGLKILGKTIAAGDRAALQVASPRYDVNGVAAAITATDFTTHGQHVAEGVDYYEPVDSDFYSSVRSTTGATVAATVLLYVI